MAFVARKPLLFSGIHYRPGDIVRGFPEQAARPEGFIRTGVIVEVHTPEPVEVKPVEKKTAAKRV